MKRLAFIILCLLAMAILPQSAVAFTVTPKNVPSIDLRSNEKVTLAFEVKFASFSSKHDLMITSELKNQECTAQTYNTELQRYVDVQLDKDRSGNWIAYGWVLPSDSSFTLQISLKGTVPDITVTRNITLFMLSETSGGVTVSGGEYKLEKRVVNPAEISTQITGVRSQLQQLKNNISVTAAKGANVTEAQKKYSEAESALTRADSLKTTNFGEAQTQLENARTAITSGQSLLEKATVLNEMEKVEMTMAQVNEMITYFKENRSISVTDSRLVAITNKYDLASRSLSSANNLISTGAYAAAGSDVQQASRFADEAMNLSQSLREEIGEGGLPISINPLYIIAGVIIVVIAIGGYFAYQKFFRWDELG
ncbi:MAG: hypothetical protein QHG99_04165 [Methanomicrobiales archaeon]|nr:hypothetical protein [Methanomicrobiales archaeon]